MRAAGVTFRFRGSEAELAGSTGDLGRMLDQLRNTSGSAVEVLLSGEHGCEVTLRQTHRRGPLQITFDDHSGQLLVQGDDSTLPIFGAALEPLDATDHAPAGGIPSHAHIEYLGEGDEAWRAPETLPLAVVHTPSR